MDEDNAQRERRGAERFIGRSAIGLSALLFGVVMFALLVALVETRSPGLLAIDRQVTSWLNEAVTGHSLLVRVLQLITALGDWITSAVIFSTLTVVLLVRRLPRLAVYVALTGLGAGVLSPAAKALVGRLRPAIETTLTTASGFSFPSGHALAATVTYGVLLLVVLPVVPRRARPLLIAAMVALIVAVGFTRIALGVHYLSDVVGGWLLGLGWLVVTTTAFRVWRHGVGLPAPVISGLIPEAARALEPAPQAREPMLAYPGRRAAELLVVWVLLLGALLMTGWLITADVLSSTGSPAFDVAVVQWLAEQRTAALTTLSLIGDRIGGTLVIGTLSVVSIVLALAVTRRWRPALFLAVTMVGEVTLFFASAHIVDRPRPAVVIDPLPPPTSSFPSGHLAAAICLYGALSLLVIAWSKSRWRWLVPVVALALVLLVAFTRLYCGVHYPTDLIGSVLLALPWLLASWQVLRPGSGAPGMDRD